MGTELALLKKQLLAALAAKPLTWTGGLMFKCWAHVQMLNSSSNIFLCRYNKSHVTSVYCLGPCDPRVSLQEPQKMRLHPLDSSSLWLPHFLLLPPDVTVTSLCPLPPLLQALFPPAYHSLLLCLTDLPALSLVCFFFFLSVSLLNLRPSYQSSHAPSSF
jgi:hypothetical protein